MRWVNLKDQKFERLTVIRFFDRDKRGEAMWLCQCICGKQLIVRGNDLKSHNTRSCGCFAKERLSARRRTHGKSLTHEYKVWEQMIQRCYNTNNPRYPEWGGRGIVVCDRWRHSFENFFVDMGACPPGMTIERKDNFKDYEPGNCVWSTRKVQANNRRSNRLLMFRGKTQSLAQWCEELNLPYGTVSMRLNKHGWPVERALSSPVI